MSHHHGWSKEKTLCDETTMIVCDAFCEMTKKCRYFSLSARLAYGEHYEM